MIRVKLWAILGSANGLGYAAVKYLVSSGQIVIAFTNGDQAASPFDDHLPKNLHMIDTPIAGITSITKTIKVLTTQYGPIDYIINNADYHLFTDSAAHQRSERGCTGVAADSPTLALIKTLLPFLQKAPKGSLINLPPQLCLATVPDKIHAQSLFFAMEIFLENIYRELSILDCRLVFIRPGMRLPDLLISSPEI